jgi:hypothetical protein
MATRFELWKQAIAQMERAIAELDQAHATLKDAGLDDVTATSRYNTVTIKDLVRKGQSLLGELREAECEDCGHLIAWHGDQYGCEYERGDQPMNSRDGGTIMAAAGPCHCQWGLEEAKP